MSRQSDRALLSGQLICGNLVLGSTSTHVRPGASAMIWPVAVNNFIGAFSEGRLQVPLTIRPLRKTQTCPEPITTGSGTTVPCESRAPVLRTATDMTTTFTDDT